MKYGIPDSDFQKLIQVFTLHRGIKKVVLFGSRAKGNFRPGSDIDLAVYFSQPIDFNQWLDLQIQLDELDLPQKVDLIAWTKIKNEELLAHIERVGKVVYET